MNTPTFRHCIRKRTGQLLILLLFTLSPVYSGFASEDVLDQSGDPYRYHDSGVLTDIYNDSIIIDKKGFTIDDTLQVIDVKGRPVPLDDLKTPLRVSYEYFYMKMKPGNFSPVVVYIKESNDRDNAQGSSK